MVVYSSRRESGACSGLVTSVWTTGVPSSGMLTPVKTPAPETPSDEAWFRLVTPSDQLSNTPAAPATVSLMTSFHCPLGSSPLKADSGSSGLRLVLTTLLV